MKTLIYFSSLLLFFSCSNTETTESQEPEEITSLVGTWDLTSYIDHSNNKTEWESYPKNVIYQKHVTETHFTWVYYDTDNDMLMGMGGGNYNLEDDQYIENIDVFYPPASSELGQSIPFEVRFEGGKWYHTGFAKEMEIDFQTGEMVAGDSTKIEEIWVKTGEKQAMDQQLAGVWGLKKYRDKPDESYFEYPEIVGYLKLITPTHFAWIKYDKEGDQIYGAGTGTYSFDGTSYQENVEMFFPQGSGQVGTSIDFNLNLTSYKWEHLGYGPVIKEGIQDSVLIDEIWYAHINSLEDEVAVSF